MESEPKLRLEDLRMEESCVTTETVKGIDDVRRDGGVGIETPTDEDAKTPENVPDETTPLVIRAETPETMAVHGQELSSTEASQSTDDTLDAAPSQLPVAAPTSTKSGDGNLTIATGTTSPTDVERSSPPESSAAIDDATPTETAVEVSFANGAHVAAVVGDTRGSTGASEITTEVEQTTADTAFSEEEEVTALSDSAPPTVETAQETVTESPTMVQEPPSPTSDGGSNNAPNDSLDSAQSDNEAMGTVACSSDPSHPDPQMESTQSRNEENGPVADFDADVHAVSNEVTTQSNEEEKGSVADSGAELNTDSVVVTTQSNEEEKSPVAESGAESNTDSIVVTTQSNKEEKSPVADSGAELKTESVVVTTQSNEEEKSPVAESSADSNADTTQSVEAEQRQVPEYRPDPPSEHGDDDDEDEDENHATITEHNLRTRNDADNDEMRVKDASTLSSDVKPDPPQLESELVVVLPGGSEETTPPHSVPDKTPPLKKEDVVEVQLTPVTENPTADRGDTMVDTVPSDEPVKRNTGNDDESYEEIIVEDDDEFFEYVDELLEDSYFDDGDDDEEVFTEVTYDSQDLKDQNLVLGNNSRSSLTESRRVIKSVTQKALEEEAASKKAEAEEARRGIAFRIARQSSFSQKDEEYQRKLQEEEAEHIRQEELSERLRVLVQEQMARARAEEAARHIAQQSEEALRKRLELEEEKRKASEAEEHCRAAEVATREKETAERARRQVEETERNERDAKKKAMEEEVRLLEIKLVEAKIAADEAKRKEKEEKKRLQAKIDARRKEKKAERMSTTASMLVMSPTQVSSVKVNPSSPLKALLSPITAVPQSPVPVVAVPVAANGVYYSIDELRKQTVPGLDYKNREIYIHPNEYNTLFGMSKTEFDEQPKWKKTNLKRKQKLF